MTAWEIVGLSLALLVMLVGLVGSLLPVIPGVPIILIAAVVHRLIFHVHGASWWVLGALTILTGLAFAFDYLAGMVGAKKLGATWRGATGAILGGIVGIFFNLPGIILGPFLGAMSFELLGGRELKPAAKAGLGAMLGLLLGAVGKIAICVVMMVLFATNVIYRSTV